MSRRERIIEATLSRRKRMRLVKNDTNHIAERRNAVATIEKKNERIQRSAERSNRNDIYDRSMELADRMSAAVQKDELYDGYTRTFSMS